LIRIQYDSAAQEFAVTMPTRIHDTPQTWLGHEVRVSMVAGGFLDLGDLEMLDIFSGTGKVPNKRTFLLTRPLALLT
jgi:hypothetical protein